MLVRALSSPVVTILPQRHSLSCTAPCKRWERSHKWCADAAAATFPHVRRILSQGADAPSRACRPDPSPTEHAWTHSTPPPRWTDRLSRHPWPPVGAPIAPHSGASTVDRQVGPSARVSLVVGGAAAVVAASPDPVVQPERDQPSDDGTSHAVDHADRSTDGTGSGLSRGGPPEVDGWHGGSGSDGEATRRPSRSPATTPET